AVLERCRLHLQALGDHPGGTHRFWPGTWPVEHTAYVGRDRAPGRAFRVKPWPPLSLGGGHGARWTAPAGARGYGDRLSALTCRGLRALSPLARPRGYLGHDRRWCIRRRRRRVAGR